MQNQLFIMCSIEDLSPEVLVKIFSHYIESEGHVQFVRNVSPVCKGWRELSRCSLLWKTVKQGSWYDLVNLANRGFLRHTQSLELPMLYYDDEKPRSWSDVLSNICKLKALDMSDYNVSENIMTSVANYCRDLESLLLESVKVNDSLDNQDLDEEYKTLDIIEMAPILNICGSKLKHLDLSNTALTEDVLVYVFGECPSLEHFQYYNEDEYREIIYADEIPFPIYKLASACPKLKKLEFSCVNIVFTGVEDRTGFKDLKVFNARDSDFHGFDFYRVLNNSMNLEYIQLHSNKNIILRNITKIPSPKVLHLELNVEDPVKGLEFLLKAVNKWKYSLLELDLSYWNGYVTSVMKTLLVNNPSPKLQSLKFGSYTVDHDVLEKLVRQCKKLSCMRINPLLFNEKIEGGMYNYREIYKNRLEVEEILSMT